MTERMVRYIFRDGRVEERTLRTTSWPEMIEVEVWEKVGGRRTAGCRKTDTFKGAARIYREGLL